MYFVAFVLWLASIALIMSFMRGSSKREEAWNNLMSEKGVDRV